MKIIFADVDGTIYDTNSIISEKLKKDIHYARSKGYKFYIATGNPILSKMNWLAKELDIRYIISSNGAGIYDYQEKKYLYKTLISGQTILKVSNLATKMDIFCDFWNEEFIYVNSLDNSDPYNILMSAALENNKNNNIKLASNKVPISAFKIEVYSNPKMIAKFNKELLKMDLYLQIATMSSNHLEITKHDVSKKTGIELLLKNISPNLNIKNCMIIGDSGNDELMLKASDYSYAMGNAPDNIKKIAKNVTGDVNKNGLGDAIRDYVSKTENKKL